VKRLTGSETLRFVLKPLKASNQPGQIAKIFRHGAAPLYLWAEVPNGVECTAALLVNPLGFAAAFLGPAGRTWEKARGTATPGPGVGYLSNNFMDLSIGRQPHFTMGNA
jgi:hypothetical protein